MLTRQKVEDLLFNFGVSPNLKGFHYIVDAVMQYEIHKPIINLYIDVGQMHDEDYSNVERAIRHAFSKMDFEDERVSEFFGESRKTNGEMIATIHLKLSREMQVSKSDLNILKRFKVFISSLNEEIDKILEESEEYEHE